LQTNSNDQTKSLIINQWQLQTHVNAADIVDVDVSVACTKIIEYALIEIVILFVMTIFDMTGDIAVGFANVFSANRLAFVIVHILPLHDVAESIPTNDNNKLTGSSP